jgi:hypothetical protein
MGTAKHLTCTSRDGRMETQNGPRLLNSDERLRMLGFVSGHCDVAKERAPASQMNDVPRSFPSNRWPVLVVARLKSWVTSGLRGYLRTCGKSGASSMPECGELDKMEVGRRGLLPQCHSWGTLRSAQHSDARGIFHVRATSRLRGPRRHEGYVLSLAVWVGKF